jgi:hypothetical protein
VGFLSSDAANVPVNAGRLRLHLLHGAYGAFYGVRQKYLTILQNSCEWNRWRGEFGLERSSSKTQSISVAMERWSVEHRAFAVETYLKNNDSALDSEDISSALQYSSERVSLVAILLPLRISQQQGVRKETKDNGGFETEHQGRSCSNFSQHAAASDAELPETLGGIC